MSVIRGAKITHRKYSVSDFLNYPVYPIVKQLYKFLLRFQLTVFFSDKQVDVPIVFKNFLKTSRPRKIFADLCFEMKFHLNIKVEQTLQTLWKLSYHYKKLSKSN